MAHSVPHSLPFKRYLAASTASAVVQSAHRWKGYMRPEEVTILSSISPVQIKENPSAFTHEFIAQMFANSEFVEQIKFLRSKNSGDENTPASIHSLVGQDLLQISDDPIFYGFQAIPEQLTAKYGIHKNLTINIALLIFFNAVIDLEDYEAEIQHNIQFIATKKRISNHLWDLPYEACALIIPYLTKVSDIKKYIDEHAEEIEQEMEKNLFSNTFIQKIHGKQALASEIIHLHDGEKLRFTDISDKLSKKYPEHEQLFDEVYINTLYHRYKRYWKLIENTANS